MEKFFLLSFPPFFAFSSSTLSVLIKHNISSPSTQSYLLKLFSALTLPISLSVRLPISSASPTLTTSSYPFLYLSPPLLSSFSPSPSLFLSPPPSPCPSPSPSPIVFPHSLPLSVFPPLCQ